MSKEGRSSRSTAVTQTDEEVVDVVRLSINLSPTVAGTLKAIAVEKGWTNTEAVRQAIGLLKFVNDAQKRGASLNIEESNGKVKELLWS